MPRHEQTCLLGYRPSPNKPHDMDHDHYDIDYICIMWSNVISVRTSAMNSSRQPKIRVLKFHGGPGLQQILKVANTWYILLV